MATNNLRVVYDNLVNSNKITTTLSASSAVLPVSNLTTDTKSLVWRTANAPAPGALYISNTVSNPGIYAVVNGKITVNIVSLTIGSVNHITLTSTTGIILGNPVVFYGTMSGGLVSGTIYYIISISGSSVTISSSPNAGTFKANLLATFSAPVVIGAVVLPFTNLSKTASITVRGYLSNSSAVYPGIGSGVTNPAITTTGVTEKFSVTALAAPYSLAGEWSWGGSGIGVNSFAYGGGTYARVYIPPAVQTLCNSIVIEISDQYNTDRYIECSRLLIGQYWSPKFNTQYGLNTTVTDLSTNERSESGDLVTNKAAMFNKLNFDLGYLTASDRNNLLNILRGSGTSKPVFVSLFPEDSDLEKERSYQIYGKLVQLSPVQNQILEFYSSSIEIEEV